MMGFIVLLILVVSISIIGWFMLKPAPVILQGEVEANEVRISGKVPGRIQRFMYSEGDRVQKGDTLVVIYSPEVQAKMIQAMAAQDAAMAQDAKAIKGARQEQISSAYEMWQKATAGLDLAKTSFDRVQRLFDKGVVSTQKRDEAEANYKAMSATEKAAKAQYQMAVNGAEKEDKYAARALVNRARGAVEEVKAAMLEAHLISPISGEVSEIFPKVGELVGTGAPILNIVDLSDVWVCFNVREDLLSKIHKDMVIKAKIPALNNREFEFKVNYIKAMASFATWKATKVSGEFDAKTFEVRVLPVRPIQGLRPGMSVLVEWEKL